MSQMTNRATAPAASGGGNGGGGGELDRLLAMDLVIKGASPAELSRIPALEAAIKRADAIEKLRDALTDAVVRRFQPLMNTALGFRTDRPNKKNPEPYSIDEVRVCMIEALLIGLRLTDNEWNIISGRCYVTREGFSRLIREHEGLSDLQINVGVPAGDRTKGVTIRYECSWRIDGKPQSIEATIPVRGDEWSTLDQLLGKGDRKIKARIWAKITGSEVSPDGDVEDAGGTPTASGKDHVAAARTDLDKLRAEAAERAKSAGSAPATSGAAKDADAKAPAREPEPSPDQKRPTPQAPAETPPWET